MAITVRSENVSDYRAIAEIEALAFQRPGYIGEVQIVDGQRHGPHFDPDLALVGEVDGQIAGHALFYPHPVILDGETRWAVSLAPLAVHPGFQRSGVGAALMEEGHRRARDKGFIYSFLLGHLSYYPRFGYQTGMFGVCALEVERAAIPCAPAGIEERPVGLEDIPQLRDMWRDWFGQVDLAIVPGESILDWVSHAEGVHTASVWIDGELQGYLRYRTGRPEELLCFLARDPLATRKMVSHLCTQVSQPGLKCLRLPVYPSAQPSVSWIGLAWSPVLEVWEAGMIKILDEDNSAIHSYCQGVAAGLRKPGMVTYPPIFEVA